MHVWCSTISLQDLVPGDDFWDLEAIICISHMRVILQNLIVSMQQNGEFSSRNGYIHGIVRTRALDEKQSRTEMDNNITQLEAKICDGVEEEAHRIMVLQTEFTDQADFVSLRTELIGVVQSSNADQ